MEGEIYEKIKEFCNTKNKFENGVILDLVEGLSGNNPKRVEVKKQKFPFYGSTKYILINTNFKQSFILFTRCQFSGRSGQNYKPDIVIFEGDKPPLKRENPNPSVIIEIKEGKQTKILSNRKFLYQILSESIDFMPKISILITEEEPNVEEDIALGYEGLLGYYGIDHHWKYHKRHFRECLPKVIINGIYEEFTRRRLKSRSVSNYEKD